MWRRTSRRTGDLKKVGGTRAAADGAWPHSGPSMTGLARPHTGLKAAHAGHGDAVFDAPSS